MSGFNLKVWASAPTTFGWRIGNSGEPLQKRFQLGNIVPGTPVLAKHSKSFSLIDCISVGVDRMQRNFEPMRKQVETWQRSELTDVTAKVVIYEAFVEGRLEAPKHLARTESRSTRNSGRERSGVSPMRSRQHSRNWIPFHSSGRRPSWANSSKPSSLNRSSPRVASAARLDTEDQRAARLASHKRVGTKPLRQTRSPARCEQCVCERMRVGHKELTYAPPFAKSCSKNSSVAITRINRLMCVHFGWDQFSDCTLYGIEQASFR